MKDPVEKGIQDKHMENKEKVVKVEDEKQKNFGFSKPMMDEYTS